MQTCRLMYGTKCPVLTQPSLTRTTSIIRTEPNPLLASAMPKTTPPASSSSSSDLKDIFDASLAAYEKKTKKSLRTHPLLNRLKACDPQPPSPDQILIFLRAQVQKIENSTSGDDRFITWLDPIVTVLCVSSSMTNATVGLVRSHSDDPLTIQSLIYHIFRLSHLPISFSLVSMSFFW